MALMQGIKRGLFSNEAGMGVRPQCGGNRTRRHPVKQGLIQTLGVFTDTLIICTCTAFIILFSGAPLDGSTNGVQLTQHALTNEIGPSGAIFVAVALFFFAFSSILGNYYYGEANVRYLTHRKWVLNIYRILVGGMVMFGAVATLDLAWSLADVTMDSWRSAILRHQPARKIRLSGCLKTTAHRKAPVSKTPFHQEPPERGRKRHRVLVITNLFRTFAAGTAG